MWVLIMLSLNNAKNKYNCSWHVKKNFWVHFTVLEKQYISNTRFLVYETYVLTLSCLTCNNLFLKLDPDQMASSSTLIGNACLQLVCCSNRNCVGQFREIPLNQTTDVHRWSTLITWVIKWCRRYITWPWRHGNYANTITSVIAAKQMA